jgi:hypothetical protein
MGCGLPPLICHFIGKLFLFFNTLTNSICERTILLLTAGELKGWAYGFMILPGYCQSKSLHKTLIGALSGSEFLTQAIVTLYLFGLWIDANRMDFH